MFIDIAKIYIKAGDGGDGAVAFHREKYVAAGGPDGGDGGKGGSIVFVPDSNMNTLMDFRYKRKYVAANGENGGKNNCSGANAPDLIIKVPLGTLIKDAETGLIIKDMSDGERFVAAKGGSGGWGNQHFATPTRQIPRFAKPGLPGEEREIQLELKLIADVGLVGFPNVGKSTFLSVVSSAKPKIANYHFTTLVPNLGVVQAFEDKSFVLADIPGLIEGAADGIGLGTSFLRHVDRCRLLIHMVDISGSEGRDPAEDFDAINKELQKHSARLSGLMQIVVGNKADIVSDETVVSRFKAYVEEKGYSFYLISAASRQGIDDVIAKVVKELDTLPDTLVYEPEIETEAIHEQNKSSREFSVYVHDGIYYVEAQWLAKLMSGINYNDYESMNYFQRVLRTNGIIDKLEEMGIKEGDTVSIYDFEFDFVK
ncbi:MAG: GTPase ObgE [Clostridia bacterium]|nr:GTPase ObgE [Clostridia bacterium]